MQQDNIRDQYCHMAMTQPHWPQESLTFDVDDELLRLDLEGVLRARPDLTDPGASVAEIQFGNPGKENRSRVHGWFMWLSCHFKQQRFPV